MNTEPQPIAASSVSLPLVSRRRRIAAYFVDLTVLATAGGAMSAMLWDPLTRLGKIGFFLGLVVEILYFTLVPMINDGGQTVGLRLLDLRIASNGDAPVASRVLLKRAAVLAFGGVMISYPANDVPGIALRSAAGVIFVLQFFFLATQGRNGRLLHDMLAHTRVVRCDAVALPAAEPLSSRHLRMSAALGIVALMGFAALGASGSQRLADAALMRELARDSNVQLLGWSNNTTVFKPFRGQGKTIKSFTVSVSSATAIKPSELRTIAQTAMRLRSEAKEADNLMVTVVKRGPTLGIFNWSSSHFYRHAPRDWTELADDALE